MTRLQRTSRAICLAAIVVHGKAPFPIVIGHVLGCRRTPVAAFLAILEKQGLHAGDLPQRAFPKRAGVSKRLDHFQELGRESRIPGPPCACSTKAATQSPDRIRKATMIRAAGNGDARSRACALSWV